MFQILVFLLKSLICLVFGHSSEQEETPLGKTCKRCCCLVEPKKVTPNLLDTPSSGTVNSTTNQGENNGQAGTSHQGRKAPRNDFRK